MMKKTYEILIISITFFIVCFIYSAQKRVTLNGGKAWDGIFYYHMVEQIQAGSDPVVGELPFIRRLGTPFLVAKLSSVSGTDILNSALYLNLAGAFITILLLYFWLRKFFHEFWITGILCFFFMMAWYAPVRYLFYVPLSSDSWGAAWFIAAMLILHALRVAYTKGNYRKFVGLIIVYGVVVAIGNIFRESNGILSILPLFIFNPFKYFHLSAQKLSYRHFLIQVQKIWKIYYTWITIFMMLPMIFVTISNSFINSHIVVSDRNVYSYLDNILTCLYTKTLPEYLLGIFIAFGPLILLAPFFWRQYKLIFLEKQELLVLLLISFLFGYIGGTDTERILFMAGFPVISIIVGSSVKGVFHSTQRWWLFILFILQTIAFRFYWTLPDYTIQSGHTPVPFFTLMSDHVKYLYLYSHFSNYLVNTILLIEYLVLFIATWYVVKNNISIRRLHRNAAHNK